METLGCPDLVPALVLGFESASPHSSEQWERFGDLPRWFFEVLVQAGGYSMSYRCILGAVLRLEGNAEQARTDPAPLIRALELMAEDPDFEALRAEYPGLLPLCGTYGERYDDDALSRLQNRLQRTYDLPPLVGGLEACVELAGDVRATLGWKCVVADQGVTDMDAQGAGWAESAIVDERMLHELERIASACAPRSPNLGLWLVWESSD